jgi:hypothetical protein
MTEGLQPGLFRSRRSRAIGITVVVIALAVHAAVLTAVVLAHDPEPAPVPALAAQPIVVAAPAVVIPPAPVVVTIPAPAPPARAPVRACPVERRDAPWVKPELPEPIDGVRPAPSSAGWIAAWNDQHVFVSTDAGATFQRVLDADGKVSDVSFDCLGRVVVLRGWRLGIRDGTREQWTTVPGFRAEAGDGGGVIGGGADVVVIGPTEQGTARVAISSDLGQSWRFHDVGPIFGLDAKVQGREDADGTIHLAYAIEDCRNDDVVSTVIRDGHAAESQWRPIVEGSSWALYGDEVVAADDVPKIDVYVTVLVPGGIPTATQADGAMRVVGKAGAKSKRMLTGVVIDGTPAAVDLAGRIWLLVCGELRVAGSQPTGLSCSGADI